MRVLPILSLEDIPPGYTVITCGISGGIYEEYLSSMLEEHGQNLCLWLKPIIRQFSLPCYDGQGKMISEEELHPLKNKHSSRFSKNLCTNYIFISQPPTVILFDDEFSLQQKVEHATKCGIPLLAADAELIKKLRLPE